MQLLFYSSGDDQNKKRLEAAIHRGIPESHIELFKRLNDFRERLRMPIEADSIAVLSASSREELQQMRRLRALLTEIYVVLVIPDRKKSTIELAHLLLPRFLLRGAVNMLHNPYCSPSTSRATKTSGVNYYGEQQICYMILTAPRVLAGR
jgi:hypothetical protein